jgi:hypothetical protein
VKGNRKANEQLSRSAVRTARIVLVALGLLWIGFGTATLIEQWPRPSWVIVLMLGFGVGLVALGCFESSATVVATAVWMLLPWS